MIHWLRLLNFRAYEEVELELDASFNRVIGPNGVGKTSLLEAITHVGFGASPWSGRSSDVVTEGKTYAVISGKGATRKQDVSVKVKYGGHKEVLLAGKKIPRLSQLLGIFPMTAIGPQEIELVKGSPGVRRRMIDSVICQMDSEYTQALNRFKKFIVNRGAAIRGIKSGEMAGGHILIESLDETIAPDVGIIMEMRSRFVEKISKISAGIYTEMTADEGGELAISYNPTIKTEGMGPGDISKSYLERLAARRKRDIDAGETVLGPHRDDLLFEKDGESMSRFGSWGQARAASIAALLAASEIMHSSSSEKDKNSSSVSLLLDDCFAELDPDITTRFIEIVARYGQVILASPRPIEPPSGSPGAVFTFDGVGKIRKES